MDKPTDKAPFMPIAQVTDDMLIDTGKGIITFGELRERMAAEERERCAKLADAELMLAHDGFDLTGFGGPNRTARCIATAIRALATQEPPQ